ncbi:MAG: fumarylacetoacetate hydrolase family protein [Rhizobiales bacterium]|nr:fumarylacetoacetate hydrolase family protein [Hyphomicrobiales bacterium]
MTAADAIHLTESATRHGVFVGRAWREGIGPAIVMVRGGELHDITSRDIPTMRDLCEAANPAATAAAASGTALGRLADVLKASLSDAPAAVRLLAPIDLQAIKAAGVTFATSMLERVIEEKARGNPALADGIRRDISRLIGDDLSKLVPGSPEAMALKKALIEKGAWSQYLEVGIGPDAEIFTKSQVMSAVGFGADVGIHPVSQWNNPEPECVLVVNSAGRIIGATLGNDVNLRDVEGRSALLLGKAKDNNASCSLGPFIRLFDDSYGLDDVNNMDVSLQVDGPDGFKLTGGSNMARISRPPLRLLEGAIGPHHQYPDGLVLFCGTVFAPTQDRDAPGSGFTHKHGDVVSVSNPALGTLINTVRATDQCPPWQFGISHLMRNLAGRGLL